MIKRIYFLSFIILIFSCRHNKENPIATQKKKNEPESSLFFVSNKLKQSKILDSLMQKEKNLQKLIHNLQDSTYTIELLKDRTVQNISNVHPLTFIKTHSVLDTAAIRSRFVLTEVHLKKLNYLINKKNTKKDTIEKILNQIIADINHITEQIQIYQQKTDEFEEILKYNSIKHDSIIFNNIPLNKKKLPPKILKNLKHIKLSKRINKKRKK